MGCRYTFVTELSKDAKARTLLTERLTEAVNDGTIRYFAEVIYKDAFYFHGTLKNYTSTPTEELFDIFLDSGINAAWISDERQYGSIGHDTWSTNHPIKD
jgi:hypothetical protein